MVQLGSGVTTQAVLGKPHADAGDDLADQAEVGVALRQVSQNLAGLLHLVQVVLALVVGVLRLDTLQGLKHRRVLGADVAVDLAHDPLEALLAQHPLQPEMADHLMGQGLARLIGAGDVVRDQEDIAPLVHPHHVVRDVHPRIPRPQLIDRLHHVEPVRHPLRQLSLGTGDPAFDIRDGVAASLFGLVRFACKQR